jgi:putative FmdB family regulatory protein
MIRYEYECDKCQHVWDEFLRLANREKPLSEPCPNCKELGCVRQLIGTPSVAVDAVFRGGFTKAKGGMKEVMQKIAESPGVKRTFAERELKSKYGL